MLTFGSLFAGIGGFDLGFERAGMRGVWQVEIDQFCQRVLRKHFPNAKLFDDVRTVGAHNLEYVDVICGGFPCQDISVANANGKGLDGERSGLWSEFARIICEVKPRWVVVENVARLLSINDGRDFGIVLADLASRGYDAEWDVLPAAAFGAPHIRERVFVVANAKSEQDRRVLKRRIQPHDSSSLTHPTHSHSKRGQGSGAQTLYRERRIPRGENIRSIEDWRERCDLFEPKLLRSLNGVPGGIHRLKGLGNAVVPQIAEWIGRRIVEMENEHGLI